MAEITWYQSYRNGNPPRCRRVSRLPEDVQWTVAIDLAISIARGAASMRAVFIGRTWERYWYWPDGDEVIPDERAAKYPIRHTGWWLVPWLVTIRARALVEAAEHAEAHVPRAASPEHRAYLARRLERWKQTGHWRKIAGPIGVRRPPPAKKLHWRQRKRGQPARKPRRLPPMPGPELRKLRTQLGLTQEETAAILGVSRSTISNLELGQTHLPVGTAIRWLEQAAEDATEGMTEAELAELTQRARAEILAKRPLMRVRKHEHAATRKTWFRAGPVAAGWYNDAAHGGVSYTEVCRCGYERNVNENGVHRENGQWGPPLQGAAW